ncbi:hypothetical protein [Bacillus phage Anath]|uniref:Fibronectin type-III domain-containing protein n=1 Tax=Bacillus phage Anath TaxID=2108114 RepID=A0A2P1JUJ9_9CAUD|nr:hypothetical protein [Bacillus phage Anath]
MAIEQRSFPLEWMEQYRLSDNWWSGGYSPIRAGSAEGYVSFLGTPAGVREAIVTSKTPAKVYLKLYFYYNGSFKVGKHQLSSRPTQSTKPYHLALSNSYNTSNGFYQNHDVTSVIRDDLVSGAFQGVTMWNDKGTPASECYGVIDNPYRAYWVVEGDWNVAPERPRLDYPTFGISVNQELEVKWIPPFNETNPSTLKYDVMISDDGARSWKTFSNATTNGVTSYKINTYSMNQTRKALVAVRAFDGEFYSEWNISDFFTIFHDVAPKAPTGTIPVVGSTIDRTAINTFAWKADPKAIQMGYQFRWRTVGADGTRGSWNYIPNSSTFVNSTSQLYNMPANTIPAGMFEWSVKTIDDFNLQSFWTTESLAISANPSTAPNMVYPTYGMVHPQATMVVEWSSVDQTQFEFFLKNSGGVTIWSTTGTTERSVKLGYTLATNEAYKIQMRVNSSGVWSSFVTTDFSVNFASPALPIIQRIEEAGSGITNVVYNQGELGINLPPLSVDGINLQAPWQLGNTGAGKSISNIGVNSYKATFPSTTILDITATLTSAHIPIAVGSTYEVSASSTQAGIRVVLRALDAGGATLGSASNPSTVSSTAVTEAKASLTLPANTTSVVLIFSNTNNVASSFLDVSGIKLKTTSPVATQLIDIYRREYTPTGDTEWEYMGGNPVVSSIPNEPDGIRGGFLDYTPASQTLYEYKLIAWNLTNKTKVESPPFQFMHKFNDTIIQDIDSITDLYFLTMVTDRDSSTEVDSAVQRFAGRKDPVREYGENETTEIGIEWEVDSWFEAKQINDLLNKREVYLYRDGSGRKMFVSTDKVNMKDKKISGFVMSCNFIKTHYVPSAEEE